MSIRNIISKALADVVSILYQTMRRRTFCQLRDLKVDVYYSRIASSSAPDHERHHDAITLEMII